MRKADMSSLRTGSFPENEQEKTKVMRSIFTVEGGALLHRVRWDKGTKSEEIVNVYCIVLEDTARLPQ